MQAAVVTEFVAKLRECLRRHCANKQFVYPQLIQSIKAKFEKVIKRLGGRWWVAVIRKSNLPSNDYEDTKWIIPYQCLNALMHIL